MAAGRPSDAPSPGRRSGRLRRGFAVRGGLAAVVLALVACGQGPDGTALPAEDAAASFGLVALNADPREGTGRLTAAFVRTRRVEPRPVLELLTGRPRLDAGACTLTDGALLGDLGDGAQVDLLSAGPLTLDRDDPTPATATAPPRIFPELGGALGGPVVAGWFYGENLSGGVGGVLPFRPGAPPDGAPSPTVLLRGRGGDDVGPFNTELRWPTAPRLLDVDRLAAGVDRADGLVARWVPAGEGTPDRGAAIEVEVQGETQGIVCAATDEGMLRVPGEVLRWLEPTGDARLVVRRVQAQTFPADGVDTAWAEVSATSSTPLVLR